MRAIFIAVVAIIILLVGGIAAWWYLNPGYVSPAAYLPASTVFYAEIPNGVKSAVRYQESKLKSLVESKEMSALAGLGAQELAQAAHTGDPEALKHLQKAGTEMGLSMSGTSFIAVTRSDIPTSNSPGPKEIADCFGVIAGFRDSSDGGAHVEACFQELRALITEHTSGVTMGSGAYAAIAYSYLEDPTTKIRICRLHWKKWDVVTVGEPALNDFIDRVSGKATTPTLLDSANYKLVQNRGAKAPDLLSYVDTEKIIDAASTWMKQAAPTLANQPMLDAMKMYRSALYTLSLQGGSVDERCVMYSPLKERQDVGIISSTQPLAMKSLDYSSSSTVYYVAANLNIEKYYDYEVKTIDAMSAAGGTGLNSSTFASVESSVKSLGLDLHENILRPLGPEAALIVDWPQTQDIADILILISINDSAKFAPFYDKISGLGAAYLPTLGTVENFQVGDYAAIAVTPKMMAQISPCIFRGSKFWGLSLSASGAKRLLASGSPLTPSTVASGINLTGSTTSAGYVNLGEIVRHGYALGRGPLGSYLTTTHPDKPWGTQLPETLSIIPTLGEWRSMSSSDGDYLLNETTSPTGTIGLVGAILGATGVVMHETTQNAGLGATPPPSPATPPPEPSPTTPIPDAPTTAPQADPAQAPSAPAPPTSDAPTPAAPSTPSNP